MLARIAIREDLNQNASTEALSDLGLRCILFLFCRQIVFKSLRTFTIFKCAVVYMYVYYQTKNFNTLLHLLVFEFDVAFNKLISI